MQPKQRVSIMSFQHLFQTVLGSQTGANHQFPLPVKRKSFRKGQIITDYGEIEKRVYFMIEGIAIMHINSYSLEKVIDFFFANDIFNSFTSFNTQNPSDVQVRALVDCKVEVVEYSDMQAAYENSLPMNRFARILTEQAYMRKAQREKNFLCKTAEELYSEMMTTHPEFITHVPVNKIAKYLGIHPESLSRIRKKINS